MFLCRNRVGNGGEVLCRDKVWPNGQVLCCDGEILCRNIVLGRFYVAIEYFYVTTELDKVRRISSVTELATIESFAAHDKHARVTGMRSSL